MDGSVCQQSQSLTKYLQLPSIFHVSVSCQQSQSLTFNCQVYFMSTAIIQSPKCTFLQLPSAFHVSVSTVTVSNQITSTAKCISCLGVMPTVIYNPQNAHFFHCRVYFMSGCHVNSYMYIYTIPEMHIPLAGMCFKPEYTHQQSHQAWVHSSTVTISQTILWTFKLIQCLDVHVKSHSLLWCTFQESLTGQEVVEEPWFS